MAIIEVKNTTERNKLIAAIVLGVLALIALWFAFGRGIFGGGTTTQVKVSATPAPRANAPKNDNFRLPTTEEQTFNDVTTPIVYVPGSSFAPDAGRNIFAFYEPPAPTPYVPTPIPPPVYVPPTPTPTPPIMIYSVTPATVYAGSKGFRLELAGERIAPDARIYFDQNELPTKVDGERRIYTEIPANFIAQEGVRYLIVQTPDGKKFSNQIALQVMAPPKPNLTYIGMIGRKRYNNDTAYFLDPAKANDPPFGARLNDVVSGRFRLVNITSSETVFEDTTLGFRHRVPLSTEPFNSGFNPGPVRGGRPQPGFQPFIPQPSNPAEIAPGIPANPQVMNPQDDRKKTEKTEKDDGVDADGKP